MLHCLMDRRWVESNREMTRKLVVTRMLVPIDHGQVREGRVELAFPWRQQWLMVRGYIHTRASTTY